MKRVVLLILLLLSLLTPAVTGALPWQCERAVETGKLSDWLVCGAWLVIYQLSPDPCEETWVGC